MVFMHFTITQVKDQASKEFVEQYTVEYNDLFKSNKQVDRDQFIHFEKNRIEPVLKQRREMSLKQAHVRFGVLDTDKDQKITLKEFQTIGLKTFNEFDKNQDGLINALDLQLEKPLTATHDGFKVKSPLAMSMPNNVSEFIHLYGKGKTYVTLGEYLAARDQQFFQVDSNKNDALTEQEYVDEFMQRYDQNLNQAKIQFNQLFLDEFHLIAKGKTTIQSKDIQKFAENLYKSLKK